MNKNRLLLDLNNNIIIFLESLLIGLSNSTISSSKTSSKVLSYLKSRLKKDIFLIRSVEVVIFYLLIKRSKLNKV